MPLNIMSYLSGEKQRSTNVQANNALNNLKNYINDVERTISMNSNLFKSETRNNSNNSNDYHPGHNDHDDDDDDVNDFSNILRLKLRKPKNWKWELSTSKSCSSIALPRILLYDHKGKLLVDAQGDQDEQIYKENEILLRKTKTINTSLTHCIYESLESEFNGLDIQEATSSPDRQQQLSSDSIYSRQGRKSFVTDTRDSRRSNSLKEVRFTEITKEKNQKKESYSPLFLTKSAPSMTAPSNSSGLRERKRYRRSSTSYHSSSANSVSILERFSFQKGRSSSPEYGEEEQQQTTCYAPRYFLSTSKAGTLVVQEDSFRHHPLRRRRNLQRNSSTENMIKSDNRSITQNKHLYSKNHSISDYSIQRPQSLGNVLRQLSTSDEDQQIDEIRMKRHQPRRRHGVVENTRYKELHRWL
uniref:Uncharacterized protein n=1 Tax=Glossina brevipalpis TaxID=37001 RepID=A0A1A9WS67_9MUSC